MTVAAQEVSQPSCSWDVMITAFTARVKRRQTVGHSGLNHLLTHVLMFAEASFSLGEVRP